MTRNTTRTLPWKRTAALLGVLVLLVGAVGPMVLAQEAGVTVDVEPSQESVDAGDTTTFDVVVQNADNVGAVEADITLTDPSVATITDVSLAGSTAFADTDITDDGSSATFAAVYGNNPIQGDGSGITVATVTVEATAEGETGIQLSGVSAGDAQGASYTVTDTNDATLTVGSGDDTPTTTTAEPTTEEPTTEEPTTEEPTTDEPTTEEPTTEEPTTEEPTTEEPTTEAPTTDEPTTEEPTTEEPTTQEPTTEEPTTEEPTTEEPTTEEPTTEEPTTEEPTTEEPTTEEPTTEEPTDGETAYYQVDLVSGEPLDVVGGPDGQFYADEDRLVRYAHGNSEEGLVDHGTAWAAEEIRTCVTVESVDEDDGRVSMTFTVEDGCEPVHLSLAAYEKPGPGFDRGMTQHLYAADTGSFGPGTHTLTVDVPDGESAESDSNGTETAALGLIPATALGTALLRRRRTVDEANDASAD